MLNIKDPIAVARNGRDSVVERDVLKWLRSIEEIPRFQYVWTVLQHHRGLGIILAKRAQLSSILTQVIFEKCLIFDTIACSSIGFTLESFVPVLGERKILSIIESYMQKSPLCVYKTLYHLRYIFKDKQQVDELEKRFNEAHPNFHPLQTYGV